MVCVCCLLVVRSRLAQRAPRFPTPRTTPRQYLSQRSPPTSSSSPPPPIAVGDQSSDEPFDPFAEPGEETVEEYDPWEPINAKVFEFNRQFDRWLLKPVAKGYNVVVPDLVQVGISNFFYNIRVTPRFMNNLFQGKFRGAGIEAGRFVVNTTAGIGGFFDVAQYLNLMTPEEDTGQTLGFYGIKPGALCRVAVPATLYSS